MIGAQPKRVEKRVSVIVEKISLVLVEVKFIGAECTPDAASVFMAIVTSIESAAMATVTMDIMATLATLATLDILATMATMATMVTAVVIPEPLLA